MTINLKSAENLALKPVITVFGIGGAGGNAVNNMIAANLQGANFVIANTDAQALEYSVAENKIQLGMQKTRGLGAGAAPDVGAEAAEESAEEIKALLVGSNMVFITAGMGGGTGTGAAPVIAKLAQEMGILTVGVVTKPFAFEGIHRMRTAEKGLDVLQKHVDTLIVIPNQNLFRIANERTTFADAFKMADEVLHNGVRSVTDLMIMPGLINLDYADIKTVMSKMGKAMIGTGEASGERRAIEAARRAIANPLLETHSMKGARRVLISVTGGSDMTLYELDEAVNMIRDEVDTEANIIFGSTFDPALEGVVRVAVVATGIDFDDIQVQKDSKIQVENNIPEEALNHNDSVEESFEEEDIKNDDFYSEELEQAPPKFEEYSIDQRYNNSNLSTPQSKASGMGLLKKMFGGFGVKSSEPEVRQQSFVAPKVSSKKEEFASEEIYDIPAFLRRKK
jgi:cell division protein FtsZ